MKKCSKCDDIKPLTEFHRRAESKDGYRPCCKACVVIYARSYYDRKLRVAIAPSGHPCAECGTPVPPKKIGGVARKFCSRACAVTANARGFADRSRGYVLKQYGLTVAQYDALVAKQHGRCAICGTTEARSKSGTWHVDHNHVTNEVRGLLCTKCNLGLGQFDDDPGKLVAAINYLQRSA